MSGREGTGRRCFLCEGEALERTARGLRYPSGAWRAFPLACAFCGVLATDEADPAACLAHLRRALAGSAFASDEAAPYGIDLYTLRTAATLAGRAAEPLDGAGAEALRRPHSEMAAAARLADLDPDGGPAISLGALCRPAEAADLAMRLGPHLAWAAEIVLLLDAEPGRGDEAKGPVRLSRRPLGGDFGAQRNALQALSRAPWMLQLDADESLDPDAGRLLPALAALAERDGAVSVGLSRRTFVDGAPTALRPDTQYRLNRADVRFAGRVHERPERPWQRSFVSLHAAIDHRISRAHAETRSALYEAMAPGRGRPEEAAVLLAAYDRPSARS